VALNAPAIEVLSNGNTIAAEFVGGLGLGSSTASAGASIAVNAFSTNTVAAIANASDTLALVYGDEVKNSNGTYTGTYVLTDDNTVGDTKVSSLLPGTDTGNKGSITTDALSVKGHNTGTIATLTVAGAVATPGDNADNSDPDKPTSKFGYVKNALTLGTAGGREKAGITLANKLFGANSFLGQVTEKLDILTTVNTGSSSQKTSDSAGLGDVKNNSGIDAANGSFSDGTTKFSISAAGSATVNIMQNNTIARVDNVEITQKTQAPALDVVAVDAALNVGASGALAVNWQKKMTTGGLKNKFGLTDPEKANKFMAYLAAQNIGSGQTATDTTNVGVGGAVSVTYLDSAVKAEASRVKIPDARDVNVRALTAGAQVAAGVGVAVAKSEGQSGNAIGAAVGVTVNIVNHDVDAILKESTIGSAAEGNINVRAIAADLQFSGGISGELAKSGSGGVSVAAGGSVVASNIVNNLNAQVDGGTYAVNDMNVEAVDALVMISAAANVGVAAGKSGAALGLALVYDGAFNTINASIDGAATITADGNISAYAHDQGLIGTINGDFMSDILSDVTTHMHILKSLGLDINITYGEEDVQEADSFKTGSSTLSVTGVTAGFSYYKELDTAGSMEQDNGDGTKDEYTLASQSSYEDENGQTKSAASLYLNGDKSGSIIISAAVAVDVSTGGAGALGASVGVNVIENNFTSRIGSGVTINTPGSVVSTADSDSFIIGVSGGAAISAKSFGGAGSVTVNYLGADVKSDLNGSINANSVTSRATNDAVMVDVVGQVAFGKKAAAGAAIGVQVLNNATEALMSGTVSAGTVRVEAESDANIYTLAAALGASTGNVALSGAVAVSQGKNDTRAVLSGSTLNGLNSLNVSAEDGSTIVSGVIGVAASKGASISGGFAYTGLGGIGNHQEVAARVENTELNTVKNGEEDAQVNVAANDHSTNVAVAIGASVGSNVAVGGAGATSNVYKDAKASLINTRTGSGAQAPIVKISSESRSINVTTAFAVSGSKSTAVGAGVAVGNINAGALTEVKNTNGEAYFVKDFAASGTSKQTIVTVGIGAAVAKTAGVAGNIAVNLIGNDTKATLDGVTINSAQNIAVLSYSRDRIVNFGGALGIAAGGNAGVGMSVAYNQITGRTQSVVADSALSATNAGSVTVRRSSLEDVTDAGDAALALVMAHRPIEAQHNVSGIVVAADAQHDLNSISISAGIGAGSDVGVGVAGNIVVNRIAGATEAAIDDTSAENNEGNVSVWANDATTAVSHLGTASVGIGGGTAGAAVGATSGTVALNRDVIARIDGGTGQNKKFNAGTIDVDAQNRASAVSSGAGIAATFGLYGSGAGSGTVGVVVVGSKTEAAVDHIDSTNSGLTINAEHSGYVGNYSAAAAVSGAIGTGAVGAGVGVVVDTSETNAKLTNSTINSGAGDVTITADNRTKVDSVVAALAAAAGIGAAGGVNFNVNVLNSKVMTTVGDSTVSTTGTFKALSNNKIETEFISATATAGAVGIGVGIGVGVGVVNTGVVTDISGSTINAGTIDIDATEHLDVDTDVAQASLGGAGFNANVSVLSIGTATQDTFGGNGEENNDEVSMSSILDTVNGGTDFDGSRNSDRLTGGLAAENHLDLASGVTVDNGTTASQSASGLQVYVRNSTLTAAQDVAIDAQKTNDADLFAVQATISSTTGIGVSIADLNVRNKVGITLDNSSIGAKSVAVSANLGGSSNLESYQGALGGTIAVNAAYSRVETAGAVSVNVKDTNIAAAAGSGNFGSVAISAGDTSKATVRSVGAAVGNIAAGVIAVQSINDSETEIKFKSTKNSAITATGGWGGSITVVSSKNNDVEATAGGGALGMTSVVGLGAEAEDNGESRIAIEGSKYTFKSTAAYFQATNTPRARALAVNAAAGLMALQVSESKADVKAKAQLSAESGNTFQTDSLNFASQVGDGSASNPTAYAKTVGVGVSMYGSVNLQGAHALTETQSVVNVGDQIYKGQSGRLGATLLTISGGSDVTRRADMRSLTVGALFATGNGWAVTKGEDTVSVTAGSTSGSVGNANSVKSLKVSASGVSAADAESDGDGGAAIDVSPLAALAENTFATGATATVNSTWNVAGVAEITASQTDNSDVSAAAVKVAGVAATGVGADVDIQSANGGTTVTFGSNANITAGTVTAKAANNVYTGKKYDYAIDADVYSAYGADFNYSNQTVNKTSLITVESGAIITTSGAQAYAAESNSELTNKSKANSVAAYAVKFAAATSKTTFTNGVTVNGTLVNEGRLKDGGITLSAHDDTASEATAITKIVGLGAAMSSIATNNVTGTNTVTLNGSARSAADLNLYAGRGEKGAKGMRKLETAAEVYNYTAIPISAPESSYAVTEANSVIVGTGASGRASRHVNVFAAGEDESVISSTTVASWVRGGSDSEYEFVGNTEGVTHYDGKQASNGATINGSLTAGLMNSVTVNISGTIVPELYYIGDSNTNDNLTIGVSVGDGTDPSAVTAIRSGIKKGTVSMANTFAARWNELQNLIEQYSMSGGNSTALLGFKAELAYLEDQMEGLGLITYDDCGRKVPVTGGYDVAAVELPALSASGGSITITSDTLSGSGTLRANGAPQVTVTNTSNAYLVLNGISIGDEGGAVTWIDADGFGRNVVKKVTDSSTQYGWGGTLSSSETTGSSPAITVTNNYTGGAVAVRVNAVKYKQLSGKDWDNSSAAVTSITPVSTIQLNGDIDNPHGEIAITNASAGGSILIMGADVAGQQVTMTATGSITQSYTDGMVAVGSTPEYLYDRVVQLQKEGTSAYTNPSAASSGTVTQTRDGLYAAMTDSINAETSSQLGLMKAYYSIALMFNSNANWNPAYKALLEKLNGSDAKYWADAILSNIDTERASYQSSYNALDVKQKTAYQGLFNTIFANLDTLEARATNVHDTPTAATGGRIAGGSVFLAAADINVNGTIQSGAARYYANISDTALNRAKNRATDYVSGMYKVNDGGRFVLQSDGSYAYEVQVYYNPSTGRLVVDDINVQGGKVYLTGRISSTGDGSIKALDGGAEISIVNNTFAALDVGRVIDNDVAGRIEITDTMKSGSIDGKGPYNAVRTIYEKGKKTLFEYLYNGKEILGQFSGVELDDYDPKSGLRYAWAEGTKTTTKTTYERDDVKGGWGLWNRNDLDTDDKIKNFLQTQTEVEGTVNKGTSTQNVTLPTGAFIMDTSQGAFTGYASSEFYRLDYSSVIQGDDTVTSFTQWTSTSGFLGCHHHTHTRWTVEHGSIQTYVHSIKADNAISISFIGSENPDISITGCGDVNLNGSITAVGSSSKVSVSARAGNSGGSITQKAGTTITANNVDLSAYKNVTGGSVTAKDGASGTVNLSVSAAVGSAAVKVTGKANVNGASAGDHLRLEADGDITLNSGAAPIEAKRIDLISTGGSIGMSTNAVKVKAGQAPTGQDPLTASVNAGAAGDIYLSQTEGDMRVGTIKAGGSVGLTSAGGFVDALPEGQAKNNDSIDALVQRWLDAGLIRPESGEKSAHSDSLAKAVTDYEQTIAENLAEYQTLRATGGSGIAANEGYAILHAMFAGYENKTAAEWLAAQRTDSASDYAKLLAARDDPSYDWDRQKLIYAISNSIINKQGGSTSDSVVKTPNVTAGGSVILIADNGGVGKDSDTATAIAVTQLSNIEKIKELASASASNVTVTGDGLVEQTYTYTDEDGEHEAKRWVMSDNTVYTIGSQIPLGLKASGVVNVTADADNAETANDIYIAVRNGERDIKTGAETEETTFTELKLGAVKTTGDHRGDVRLLGKNGVSNALAAGVNVTAANLVIEAGQGHIGVDTGATETVDPVTVDLSGWLNANAGQSVYITNANSDVLTLDASAAGKTLTLKSAGGFAMADDSSVGQTSGAKAYLNAGTEINLLTDASVGTAERAINILANGTPVNITNAAGTGKAQNVYISGLTSDNSTNGTLLLGRISASGTVEAGSKGALNVGRDEVKDGDEVTVSAVAGDVDGSSVKLTAATSLTANGTIDTSNGDLVLTADDGDLTLTSKGTLNAAGNASLTSGKSATMNAAVTSTGDTTITAEDGAVTVNANVTASGKTITVKSTGGSIAQTAGTMTAGTLQLTSAGAVTQTSPARMIAPSATITAANGISLATAVATTGGYTSNEFGQMTLNNDSGNVAIANGGSTLWNVTFGNGFKAADLTLHNYDNVKGVDATDNALQTSGQINATGSVSIVNDEVADMTIDSAIIQAKAVEITSGGSLLAKAAIESTAEGVTLTAATSLTAQETITGKTNVTLTAQSGNVSTQKTVQAATGSVAMTAAKSVETDAVAAAQAITLTAQDGGVTNNGALTADADAVTMSALNGSITNNAAVSGVSVTETATGGSVIVGAEVKSTAGSVTLSATDAEVDGATADGAGKITVTAAGSVSSAAEAELNAQNGDIETNGAVTAADAVTLTAENGSITTNAAVSGSSVAAKVISGADDTTGTGTGSIAFNGNVTATGGTVSANTGTGSIMTAAGKTVSAAGDISVNVSTQGDITLNGTTKTTSDGAIAALTAGGSVSNTGAINAQGDVTLTSAANGSVDNSGTIEAQNEVTLTAAAGAIDNSGPITAQNAVTLDAETTVTNSGAVESTNASVTLDGKTGVSNAANLTAGTSVTETSAGGSISNTAGTITAGGAVAMTAKADITNSAAVTSVGTAAMTAQTGRLTNSGEVKSSDTAKLTAAGDITNTGRVTAANALNMSSTGGSIDNDAALASTADAVTLTAARAIDNSGPITAQNAVTVDAETTVTNSGAVESTNASVTLDGKTSVSNTANLTARTSVTETSAGGSISNAENTTITSGTTTTMTAKNGIENNAVVDATGALSQTAQTGSIGNTAALSGSAVSMTANGEIVNGANASVTANSGALTQTALTGSITNEAAVEAASGELTQTAAADIANGSTVTAGTTIAMTAGGSIADSGAVKAGTDLTQTAQGGAIANKSTTEAVAGSATQTAKTDITNTGAVTAGTTIAMTAGENITNSGAVKAGTDLSQTAQGGAIANKSTTEAASGSAAQTAKTDIANTGAVTVGTSLTQTAQTGSIGNNAAVQAGTDAVITAKTNVENGASVTTGKSLTQTAQTGSIGNAGAVTSGTSLAQTAATDITNASAVTSGTTMTQTAQTGSLTDNGAVTSGAAMTLKAGTDIRNAGPVTSDAAAAMEAGNDVENEEAVKTAEAVTMSAQGGSITNRASVESTGGTVAMTAKTDIRNEGDVTANGDLSETSRAGSITNLDTTEAKTGAITLTAKKDIMKKGDVTAAANVTEAAETGSIVNNGSVTSTASGVTMTADTGITTNGSVSAATNVEMDSRTGGIIVDGSTTATNGSVTAENKSGSVTLGKDGADTAVSAGDTVSVTANNGTITANSAVAAENDVNLTTVKGDITTNGTVTAENGSVNATAGDGNITTNASVTAGTDVSLTTSTGDIETNDAVKAAQNVSMTTAAGDITTNDAVTATDKDVAMTTTSGAIRTAKNVTAGANVTQQSDDSSITNEAAVKSGADTLMTAAKDIMNNEVEAGANAVMTAGGSITDSGAVKAGTDLTQTAQGGAIFNKSTTEAASGSAAQTAKTDIANTGTVTAGTTIAMTAGENITNSGAVKAGTDLTQTAQGGAILNKSTTEAATGIAAQTAKTDIANTGAVKAGTSLTQTAQTGSIGNNAAVQAGTDAVITAKTNVENGASVTTGKSLTQTAQTGSISNAGAVIAGTSLTQTAAIDITNVSTATSGTAMTQTAQTGSLTDNGALTSGAAMKLKAGTDITNVGPVTSDAAATMEAGNTIVNKDSVKTAEAMSMTARSGSITNSGNVDSTGSTVAMTAKTDIRNEGDVTAHGDLSEAAQTGSITNLGTTGSTTGEITLTAKKNITKKGNVTAAANVTETAETGAIVNSSSVTSEAGGVTMTAGTGITTDGSVSAAANVEMRSRTGDIAANGTVTAENGSVNATAGDGNITTNAAVTAATDVNLTTANGDITTNAAVKAAEHVNMTTGTGAITANGTVTAENGGVTATAGEGSVTTNAAVKSGKDTKLATETGNITVNDSINSGANFSAAIADVGDITINAAVNAGDTMKMDTAKEGTINLHANITAANDMTLHANDGSILFTGKNENAVDDITAASKNGSISISLTGTGNVKDTHRQTNGDRGFVKAAKGDVSINHDGNGIVDLYGIYAEDEAKLETENGDIYVTEIDGELVAMVTHTPGTIIDAEHVTAGTQIQLSGSDLSLAEVTQRVGRDGLLEILPTGAGGDTPIDDFRLGNIKTNNGVRFPSLWLRKGDVTVSQGAFVIDRLFVIDKATFRNSAMTTNVYGSVPLRENVSNTYWIDTAKNDPARNLHGWLNEENAGRWMDLRFLADRPVQRSTGNLLNLRNDYWAYRQRYTQETWSRIFGDRDYYALPARNNLPAVGGSIAGIELKDIRLPEVKNAPSAEIVLEQQAQ